MRWPFIRNHTRPTRRKPPVARPLRSRVSMERLEDRTVPSFAIRATEFSSGGAVEASSTQTSPLGPGNGFLASFALPDFSIAIVTNNSTTGSGFSSHSATINILYNGPTGANSDNLLIEVLGDSYTNPSPGNAAITSNASPSTSGLMGGSVTMTSGVLNGTAVLSGTPGTTLAGQLGMTTASGTMGGASSVLTPNPTTGATFGVTNPFTFYQTYTFGAFSTAGQAGSMSAGSTVRAVSTPTGSLSGSKLLATATPGEQCRVTGGGSVFTAVGDIAIGPNGNPLPIFTRITHGFQLRNPDANSNSLEINWGGGQNFHLTTLTAAVYLDEPGFEAAPPKVGCDTLVASGIGRFNGVDGYTIWLTFTDHGEPGKSDTAAYLIKAPNGNVVLSVGGQTASLTPRLNGPNLDGGNHQFHKDKSAALSGGTTNTPWNPAVNGPVEILLLNSTQTTLVAHTPIVSGGTFSFTGIAPGTYVVAEQFQSIYSEMSPTSGTAITYSTVVTPPGGVIGPWGFTVTVTAGSNTQISAPFINELTPVANCRWTGGGSIFTDANDFALSTSNTALPAGTRITHGMQLDDPFGNSDTLEINWGGGQNFHLTTLTSAVSFFDPNIGGPAPPQADCNTIIGTGVGSFNNVDGYNIAFTFTDQGEPGTSDTAKYLIWKDNTGGTDGIYDPGIDTRVLQVDTKSLDKGNQQAHVDKKLTASMAKVRDAAAPVLLQSEQDLRHGVVTVTLDSISGMDAAAAEARFRDAVATLNAEMAPAGVTLVEVSGVAAADAAIHVHIGPSTVDGGVAEGVLGLTIDDQTITIVSGWDWYLGSEQPNAGQYDFETVVTHELGHTLGLGHSSDPNSVMYASLASGLAHHDLTANDLTIIDHDDGATHEPFATTPTTANPSGDGRTDAFPVTPPPAAVSLAPFAAGASMDLSSLGGAATIHIVPGQDINGPLVAIGRDWLGSGLTADQAANSFVGASGFRSVDESGRPAGMNWWLTRNRVTASTRYLEDVLSVDGDKDSVGSDAGILQSAGDIVS